MGPGLAHWVANQLLLCGQWGQGLRTGLPSSCCVANGARACALGCQAVVVVWPMGPGLAHWVAKQLLLCGQWGQGLSTGLPSGCCCVANWARACALGCQAAVVVWPMGPGLEHWVAKRLLLRGQWGQGLSTGLPSGCCFSRLSLLVGCCFLVLLPAFVLPGCCPLWSVSLSFFSPFFAFSHCWRGDVVAASVRFARAHRLAGSCPVV